jgi:hypothetical protein
MEVRPPIDFVTVPMQRVVMATTQWYRKLNTTLR